MAPSVSATEGAVADVSATVPSVPFSFVTPIANEGRTVKLGVVETASEGM